MSRNVRPRSTEPALLLVGSGVPIELANVNRMPVTVVGSRPAGKEMAEPVWNGPSVNSPGVHGAGEVQKPTLTSSAPSG